MKPLFQHQSLQGFMAVYPVITHKVQPHEHLVLHHHAAFNPNRAYRALAKERRFLDLFGWIEWRPQYPSGLCAIIYPFPSSISQDVQIYRNLPSQHVKGPSFESFQALARRIKHTTPRALHTIALHDAYGPNPITRPAPDALNALAKALVWSEHRQIPNLDLHVQWPYEQTPAIGKLSIPVSPASQALVKEAVQTWAKAFAWNRFFQNRQKQHTPFRLSLVVPCAHIPVPSFHEKLAHKG